MSKYHKIIIEEEEFIVRDVSVLPFGKKFRVAPNSLKEKILDKKSRIEDVGLITHINNRIHFYTNSEFLHLEDIELSDYLVNNVDNLKNNLVFDI